MLISLLEVCQKWGVKKGGTWRMLRVSDWRHGGQGHPWCHGWCFFNLRKIPWKFRVDIFIRSVSGMEGSRRGVLGGHWGFLIGDLEDWVIFDVMDDVFFTLRKIPWKFRVDIFIRSVSGMGGQEGGYLEDVEGSWPETWRTGSSLTLWMYLVDPKDHILKILCWYLY